LSICIPILPFHKQQAGESRIALYRNPYSHRRIEIHMKNPAPTGPGFSYFGTDLCYVGAIEESSFLKDQ